MSLRYFEGEGHAKVYAQFRPTPPPNLIKRLVDFLKEKYDGPLEMAVDLGCGNGQCTFSLRNEFASVLGTDISPAQISEANELCKERKCDNVKFQAASADDIPVADKSVQLITICEAAHWMDLPKVYVEVERKLVKNGVFAIIGYHLPKYTPQKEDEGKMDAINKAVDKTVEETHEYWPKEIWSCLSEYQDVVIPFSDFTRENTGYSVVRTATLNEMEGSIRTYSPFQTFCREKGESAGDAVLTQMRHSITSVLNEGRAKPLTPEEVSNYKFTATINYFILMARV